MCSSIQQTEGYKVGQSKTVAELADLDKVSCIGPSRRTGMVADP